MNKKLIIAGVCFFAAIMLLVLFLKESESEDELTTILTPSENENHWVKTNIVSSLEISSDSEGELTTIMITGGTETYRVNTNILSALEDSPEGIDALEEFNDHLEQMKIQFD